jgi:hypothetical protein
MAEAKGYSEKQKVEWRVGVRVDFSPETGPIILLGNENMPVAIVLDVLRGAQ